MKNLLLLVALMASPAWAQTQSTPKSATARADSLRAHWQDRKGRTGLFDEMRQSAGDAGTTAASSRGKGSRAAPGAGGSQKWTVRLVV